MYTTVGDSFVVRRRRGEKKKKRTAGLQVLLFLAFHAQQHFPSVSAYFLPFDVVAGFSLSLSLSLSVAVWYFF